MSGVAEVGDGWHAEAHRALGARVDALTAQVRDLGAVEARLAELEQVRAEDVAGKATKRNRAWMIGAGLATALLCPLAVTAIITLLHLGGS